MGKIRCYNCNGTGEKLVSRGNHASIFKVHSCYRCNSTGELDLTIDSLKESLIHYLKNLNDSSIREEVTVLWSNAKYWATTNSYIMGGSYASWGEIISVNIRIKNKNFRFTISFEELK
jgi:hypothetical protein